MGAEQISASEISYVTGIFYTKPSIKLSTTVHYSDLNVKEESG
jgi:hypothetical protein